MHSFASFLDFAAASEIMQRSVTQTRRIQLKCGGPMCSFDEVLHTERMAQDWAALLRRYPDMPQVVLPRVNTDSVVSFAKHPWGPPPQTTYTPAMRKQVQQMERWVFSRFNYSM